MNKLNREEFKKLIIDWKSNFISERMNPSTKSTLEKFTVSKGNESELIEFPITLINFNINNEDEYYDVVDTVDEMKNFDYDFVRKSDHDNASTIVLYNSESNKDKLINSELFEKYLSQEDINQFKNASYSENIIIQAETGDFYSIEDKSRHDKETAISRNVFTLHDVYHTTLDYTQNKALISNYFLNNEQKKSLEEIHSKFEHNLSKEDHIDYNIFMRYVFDKLSGDKLHHVDSDDLPASLFAFLFLFIMDYDKSKNKINIEKSIENIDNLKHEIVSFTYKSSYHGYHNSNNNIDNQDKIKNVDFIINHLKTFFISVAELFQEIYLDREEKYIIISVIG